MKEVKLQLQLEIYKQVKLKLKLKNNIQVDKFNIWKTTIREHNLCL